VAFDAIGNASAVALPSSDCTLLFSGVSSRSSLPSADLHDLADCCPDHHFPDHPFEIADSARDLGDRSPVLIAYGGISAKLLKVDNEYWRLFTNVFVSGSISQLFVNVALEFIFVLSREASWNALRLVATFLLSAVCGAFVALVFNPNGFAIGASAGIFGVYGRFVALYGISFEGRHWKHRIAVLFMLFLQPFQSMDEQKFESILFHEMHWLQFVIILISIQI
jgi:membrane associated rhomboid family serine protease